MTLYEIMSSNAEFLTPEQASEVIGCKPYAINVQAQADATKLGFPVCVMGTRVRIPRRAFLRWLECGNAPAPEGEQLRREIERLLTAAGGEGASA